MILRAALAGLALSLGGCSHSGRMFANAVISGAESDWRTVATDGDRERLREWRDTWLAALDAAKPGDTERLTTTDKLFLPDYALDHGAPPVGDYRCRIFRLGARDSTGPEFAVSASGTCRIEVAGAHLRFTRLEGRQRSDGLIFTGNAQQSIFLGTLLFSDEAAPIPYGADDRRDMIGVVDRVDKARWRIAIPDQALGPKLQLIELTPAGN